MKTLFPLIISNTDMSLLSMCELRWFRERCQNLRKPSFNIDLTAGSSFAKGLEITREAFYNDKKANYEAIALGYNYILESMHSEMSDKAQDTNVLKSPERMALALQTYFKKFPLESDTVVPAIREDGSHAIEHKITIELPILHPELNIPLIFKAKLDMLATEMGRTFIVDEKTTKAISSSEASLLQTAGQFCGYAWAAREKGIRVEGVKVRKVAIQIKDIKVEEFEIPITEFMIDMWYKSFIYKLTSMVNSYKYFIAQAGQINIANGSDTIQDYFIPDYQLGCTSYYRPCPFTDGCTSKYGEKFLESSFEQIVWESEERKEIGLEEYRKLLGLAD